MQEIIFLRSSNGLYGAESVILGLARSLPELGWNTEIWMLEHPDGSHALLENEAINHGIKTKVFPCAGRLDVSTLLNINKAMRSRKGAILMANDVKTSVYAWLATRMSQRRLAATLHGWTHDTVSMRFYERLERFILRRFDCIVCVSSNIAKQVPKSKAIKVVIDNGVDTEKFRPETLGMGREYWGLPDNAYVFGVFARMTPEKGHTRLLRAFKSVHERCANCFLLMCGDGPEEAAIRSLIAKLELGERVIISPPHKNIPRALQDIDCYVSPSLTEGLPMIVLEAMASGVPVVATAVGGLPALLEGDCGSLVAPDDLEALEAALVHAATEPESVRQLTENALCKVRSDFSLSTQAMRYSEVLAGTGR